MTDQITPEKLRKLAREIVLRDGQMAGTRPAFPMIIAAHLRAAADEIERLRGLDPAQSGFIPSLRRATANPAKED
jgi:hypothetical protein